MLVDINLLPRKEKKSSWSLLTIIIVMAVLAALLAAGWFYFQSLAQKAEQLEKQLAQNQMLRQTYENQANTSKITPADELIGAVQWAQANRKETYVLLQHITSLLPERGFVQTFSFETAGSAALSVQFDSTRQAADFLNHMQNSSYMKSVELQSISTTEVDSEDEPTHDDKKLPRYLANYQLELDLNELLTEDQSEEESPS